MRVLKFGKPFPTEQRKNMGSNCLMSGDLFYKAHEKLQKPYTYGIAVRVRREETLPSKMTYLTETRDRLDFELKALLTYEFSGRQLFSLPWCPRS